MGNLATWSLDCSKCQPRQIPSWNPMERLDFWLLDQASKTYQMPNEMLLQQFGRNVSSRLAFPGTNAVSLFCTTYWQGFNRGAGASLSNKLITCTFLVGFVAVISFSSCWKLKSSIRYIHSLWTVHSWIYRVWCSFRKYSYILVSFCHQERRR